MSVRLLSIFALAVTIPQSHFPPDVPSVAALNGSSRAGHLSYVYILAKSFAISLLHLSGTRVRAFPGTAQAVFGSVVHSSLTRTVTVFSESQNGPKQLRTCQESQNLWSASLPSIGPRWSRVGHDPIPTWLQRGPRCLQEAVLGPFDPLPDQHEVSCGYFSPS